ncbi:MAG: prepilin-type N-terminal cleavage/methylation domain-containing protein [Candidatus Riflebacteria bacterium]|nr:prepilin-type N-terminal cleavage/methylation domain-containing protein [Candidatus Riflebacteria bacterium]
MVLELSLGGAAPRWSFSSISRRGFTLTEIMVALLVAMFGIIPMLNLNTISRRQGQQGEAYALAQIEAERLVNHFANNVGFDEMNYRILGGESETVLTESEPEVAAVLEAGTGLDQAAMQVKRRVELRRLEAGLLHLSAVIEWQSTAPVRDLRFVQDRFIGNQRVSASAHAPFTVMARVQRCN